MVMSSSTLPHCIASSPVTTSHLITNRKENLEKKVNSKGDQTIFSARPNIGTSNIGEEPQIALGGGDQIVEAALEEETSHFNTEEFQAVLRNPEGDLFDSFIWQNNNTKLNAKIVYDFSVW
jgi:hypothetical protein